MPGERHPGQQREHRPQAVDNQQDGVGPPQAHCGGPALTRVMVTHGDNIKLLGSSSALDSLFVELSLV